MLMTIFRQLHACVESEPNGPERTAGMTFTEEQIRYLEALPAVEHATATRITYTDEFKTRCMERYAQGASPTALFREAGLDPRIVGYKRIERSFARWREVHDVPAHPRIAGAGALSVDDPAPNRGVGSPDPRDLLIARQLHRITELERELAELAGLMHVKAA